MSEETLKIDLIQAHAINLKEGDVLMVTVKSDEIDRFSMELLNEHLKELFPNNKVMIFGMHVGDDVKFTIASKDESKYDDTKDVSEEVTLAIETAGECND